MKAAQRAAAALFAVVVTVLLAIVPSVARAEAWVELYEVDVTPSGDDAHFKLLLRYGVTKGEQKNDGFKFVGKTEPRKVRFTSQMGNRVNGNASREASSGEWKLSFQLPEDKTILIEFDQALEVQDGGWSGRTADVAWAPNFKIRVDKSTYRVHGTPKLSGWTCAGDDCTLAMQSPGAFSFKLGGTSSRALDIALTLAGLGAAVAMILLKLKAKRAVLLATRGVVPPVPEVAYPEGTYRAPPPIVTKAPTPDPVLTREDATMLQNLFVSRLLAVVITVSLLGFAKLPIRVGYVEFAGALVAGVFAVFSIGVDRGGALVLAVPPIAALLCLFSPVAGAVGAFFVGLFALVSTRPPNRSNASWGGSSSGSTSSWSSSSSTSTSSSFWSSSSSSSSSCGGGGGSSCGGGGGGCGGGGGGGGCGG